MDNRGLAHLSGVLVVALVVVAPVVIVAASQSAIPGDALYGLKRATEVITAPSALQKLDRRVGELEALVDRNADPELIGRSIDDLKATIDVILSETVSVEGIERAKAALSQAEDRLASLLGDPDMPVQSQVGLGTALDAVQEGQAGLDVAEDRLESLPEKGNLPDERNPPDAVTQGDSRRIL